MSALLDRPDLYNAYGQTGLDEAISSGREIRLTLFENDLTMHNVAEFDLSSVVSLLLPSPEVG